MAENRDTKILRMLQDEFGKAYSSEAMIFSRAPGRLEILGNHTDYNEGLVLSMAVDLATYVAISPAQNCSQCRVLDIVHSSFRQFSLNELDNKDCSDWCNYVKGLIVELNLRGIKVPAFDAVLYSELPLAAGMGSSAALEISMLLALLKLCNIELNWLDCAKIAQACENNYVGVRTGLLDQISSLKGEENSLILSDFRSLEIMKIPFPEKYVFAVLDSLVKHNLSKEYNERRASCEEALAILQKKWPALTSLRDVNSGTLMINRDLLPDLLLRRAMHVVSETERVEQAAMALMMQNMNIFARLLQDSQWSSQKCFENSCEEIDFLFEKAATLQGFLGGRLSGGGFGGISLHLLKKGTTEKYLKKLESLYLAEYGRKTQGIICNAANGAGLVE